MLESTVAERDDLVARLIAGLAAEVDSSTVLLHGSLAEGRADAFSDVDLLWDLPDSLFAETLARVPAIVDAIQPVDSLRSDLDLQYSDQRRLFFVRFKDLPLFWRLDLHVMAQSLQRDLAYDLANPAARGDDWSWPESALSNAVAAVKAHLRGRDGDAWDMLGRAYHRVGLAAPEGNLFDAIRRLVQQCVELEPGQASYAGEVQTLAWHGMSDARS